MANRSDRFWQEPEDWSRRKHLILGYYLQPAAPKLRQVSPDSYVVLIDGFAGRGKYEDNTPGSPILLAQLADKCLKWNTPVELRIYNVERKRSNYRQLEACTRGWVEKGIVTNLRGSFQDLLPGLLHEASSRPVFAFLDPFAPSHLLFQDLSRLLVRSHPTELLIVFHTPAVLRMIRACLPGAQTDPIQKQRLERRLSEVFGDSRWSSIAASEDLDPELVVSCFVAALQDRASRAGFRTFVLAHRIEARYKVGLKYHIVFYTRHPDGVELMNDAFCKETHEVYGQAPERAQLSLGFDDAKRPAELTPIQRRALLCEALIRCGMDSPGKDWKRDELIFESICRSFGEFSRSEHLQAYKELLKRPAAPRVRIIGGQSNRSGTWRDNERAIVRFEL